MHPDQKRITLNWYFLIPFLLWVIAGGMLLLSLDKRVLFASINTMYSSTGDVFMEYATVLGEGLFIAVLILSLLFIPAFRNRWYILGASICTILPSVITQFIKFKVAAPRPMAVYGQSDWIHHLETWPLLQANGFPSGHTTGAFSLFCFLSLLLPNGQKVWGFLFFALALLVGYSRMYLAAHFFDDVYAGSIIGCVVALAAYTFVMKTKHRYLYKKATTAS